MAIIPPQLRWEIAKKNNSFLVKQFGNGTASVKFSKMPNNLCNLQTYKHSEPVAEPRTFFGEADWRRLVAASVAVVDDRQTVAVVKKGERSVWPLRFPTTAPLPIYILFPVEFLSLREAEPRFRPQKKAPLPPFIYYSLLNFSI
ncbi:hypothetical protein OROGR_005053 [Orobanche gracilis]